MCDCVGVTIDTKEIYIKLIKTHEMCQLVCGYVLVTLTGVVVALTIYLIYRRQRWASRYFSEQGVDCDTPWPLFGNLLWLVAGRKALTDILTDVHGRSKASG